MNTGKSFSLGWAAFGAAGIGGGFLGWRQNQFDQKIRIEENVEHNKRRNEILIKAEERMKRDGSVKFKDNRASPSTVIVAKSPSPASPPSTAVVAAAGGHTDTKDESSSPPKPPPPPTHTAAAAAVATTTGGHS